MSRRPRAGTCSSVPAGEELAPGARVGELGAAGHSWRRVGGHSWRGGVWRPATLRGGVGGRPLLARRGWLPATLSAAGWLLAEPLPPSRPARHASTPVASRLPGVGVQHGPGGRGVSTLRGARWGRPQSVEQIVPGWDGLHPHLAARTARPRELWTYFVPPSTRASRPIPKSSSQAPAGPECATPPRGPACQRPWARPSRTAGWSRLRQRRRPPTAQPQRAIPHR